MCYTDVKTISDVNCLHDVMDIYDMFDMMNRRLQYTRTGINVDASKGETSPGYFDRRLL